MFHSIRNGGWGKHCWARISHLQPSEQQFQDNNNYWHHRVNNHYNHLMILQNNNSICTLDQNKLVQIIFHIKCISVYLYHWLSNKCPRLYRFFWLFLSYKFVWLFPFATDTTGKQVKKPVPLSFLPSFTFPAQSICFVSIFVICKEAKSNVNNTRW